MAEKERSFKNRTKNVFHMPGRALLGTPAYAGTDIINTTAGFGEQLSISLKKNAKEIADLFSDDKKWYQKALNIPVAVGKSLVGTVEAAVKPVVNGAVNLGKTVRNTVSNLWKSTFGSVFSAKPLSDFSYNTRKTKDGKVKLIDTNTIERKAFDPNETWTKNRGKWTKTNGDTPKKEEKPEKKSPSESSKNVVPAALTAASVGTIVAEALKKNNESFGASIDKKIKAITDSFSKTVGEAITTLQNDNNLLKQEVSNLKAIEMKPENDGNSSENKKKGNDDKKDDKKNVKIESENDGKKGGKKPDADKEGGIDAARTSLEIGDSKEFSKKLLKDTPLLPIFESILKEHPNLEINYNKNTIGSSITLGKKGYNDCIEIGSKIPENNISCAPMNWSNDHETQIRFSLGHEIAHFVFNKKKNENELLKICEKYAKDDKHLSSLSNGEIYDTSKKKALEDACELFTLYCTNKKGFYDYLDILSSDDEKAKETRNKYKLSKIENKNDIEDIKNECKKLANYCLNHYTQENMEGSIGAIAA